MFYCNKCRCRCQYPESICKSICKSYGMCEICKETNECNNVPSYALPDHPSSFWENYRKQYKQ